MKIVVEIECRPVAGMPPHDQLIGAGYMLANMANRVVAGQPSSSMINAELGVVGEFKVSD